MAIKKRGANALYKVRRWGKMHNPGKLRVKSTPSTTRRKRK